ncbi:MAG: 1,4-alpha-glucan branching protein domain-containing protein [Pseudomonadota bacterium]
MRGYLLLILHAHLPFVRHPEHDRFREEDWFFEALTECYLPLLTRLGRLSERGVPFQFALSLSPTLISMLEDELLQERYARHLERLTGLAEKELTRTRAEPDLHRLARFHHGLFQRRLEQFEVDHRRRLLPAFRALRDAGHVEFLGGTATHAYLPLLRFQPAAIRAQLRAGAACCRQQLGADPQGIWLAECGYYPGLEHFLREAGARYFFLETHGVENSRPRRAPFAPYEPLRCPSGLVAFGRDQNTCRQVWSAEAGYPGDPAYREFHHDIARDLPLEYLGSYFHDGLRAGTGIKYLRVTGGTGEKQPYLPGSAAQKARLHAADFVFKLRRQVRYLEERMERPPVVVAPYDAELFGHWWFEGPIFLEALIRELAAQDEIRMITPSACLERSPAEFVAQPAASSWGAEGHNSVWLSEENDWIWPQLHQAAEAMGRLVSAAGEQPDPLTRRALDQALRSLLLAQGSDWPFMIRAGTTADYARRRLQGHLAHFFYLEQAIRTNRLDLERLEAIEELDSALPGCVDYRFFQ